ncbi:hypothetical protein [uncultured Gammaproteobacteria bacterium]|jgi:plasmid replication initiation protein|nr:hypothetical protein [uncultured Gammaproteobacteria bacterium]VVH60376.1 hypothetical protein BAZOLSSOX_941 [uncultured Gammaproteobacteria bacterium]
MEQKIKHSTIIKSNSLVNAIYKMPVNSSHLFNIMLRHITANDVISDDGRLHTITAVEYGKLLGIDDKHRYNELKIATNFLLSAVIKVPVDTFTYEKYSIFDTARYAVGEGYTSLAFSRNFLPFIQGLNGDYTRLDLAQTLRFKKFASVRIYEKLMQYSNSDFSGWWRVGVDDLKSLLSIDHSSVYSDTRYFNTCVFYPAIAEISKQLSWDIKVEKIKIGRIIKEFKISFKDVNSGGLFSQDNLCRGNKQTQLSKAHRAADARAKVSRLSHLKKIGIK